MVRSSLLIFQFELLQSDLYLYSSVYYTTYYYTAITIHFTFMKWGMAWSSNRLIYYVQATTMNASIKLSFHVYNLVNIIHKSCIITTCLLERNIIITMYILSIFPSKLDTLTNHLSSRLTLKEWGRVVATQNRDFNPTIPVSEVQGLLQLGVMLSQ